MKDPAIEGKLNRWMPKIIDGNRRALNSLMRNEWMLWLLCKIAVWAERKKNITCDEELGTAIQELITARIRAKLHTLKNPNNAPWSNCVCKWSYRVAGNLCEDLRKKNARFVVDCDVEMSSLVSTLPSSEEVAEREEQEPLRKRLKSRMPAAASRARASAAADEQQILSLWIEGDTLKEIEEKTGISLSTVQRKLKKVQRAIVKGVRKGITEEVGEKVVQTSEVMNVLQEVVEHRGHLRDLLTPPRGEARRRAPRQRA